jgi:pimeloyl-ACP methyl ester carboxylesterase
LIDEFKKTGNMAEQNKPIPFSIVVAEQELEDLKTRLALTRWTDEILNSDWDYGTSLSYLKELVDYWQNQYDWRAQESRLNEFSQFTVQQDDIRLHFIHVEGKGPHPFPLLLSHGWPGSIAEFIKIIEPLTDPVRYGGDADDAFSVVAPSLPGYGFSHAPNQRRVSAEETADLFHRLMTETLGYSKYIAQGGDWGSLITAILGYKYPDSLVGIHLNMIPVAPDRSEISNLSAAEEKFFKQVEDFRGETGYQWIQGTKPQTLGVGLNDSPAGLAAWITEKFYTWTDCAGEIESSISKDELLTNIMIYWITQTINSSFWLYYQSRHDRWALGKGERITVPTAVASFPKELVRPPREWAERTCNVTHWTDMKSGGHFAALEKPDELVQDIRSFRQALEL